MHGLPSILSLSLHWPTISCTRAVRSRARERDTRCFVSYLGVQTTYMKTVPARMGSSSCLPNKPKWFLIVLEIQHARMSVWGAYCVFMSPVVMTAGLCACRFVWTSCVDSDTPLLAVGIVPIYLATTGFGYFFAAGDYKPIYIIIVGGNREVMLVWI